jgi:hypothetical protein
MVLIGYYVKVLRIRIGLVLLESTTTCERPAAKRRYTVLTRAPCLGYKFSLRRFGQPTD